MLGSAQVLLSKILNPVLRPKALQQNTRKVHTKVHKGYDTKATFHQSNGFFFDSFPAGVECTLWRQIHHAMSRWKTYDNADQDSTAGKG